jgi:hypothetical protein
VACLAVSRPSGKRPYASTLSHRPQVTGVPQPVPAEAPLPAPPPDPGVGTDERLASITDQVLVVAALEVGPIGTEPADDDEDELPDGLCCRKGK